MTTRSIETEAPGVLARSDDAEHLAWVAARTRRLWRRRALPTLGIVGLLLLWWAVVVWFDVKPFVAPSPVVVLQTLYAKRDILLANLLPTAIEAAGGFFLGNLAAILVATVFVHSKTLQDIFFPVVLMFNAIPIVAKAPILVLIMGNGMEPKITIAALVCFFPTLVNTVRGLESVNPQAMELMRVLSASKTEIFFRLRLFNALPYLFSALRIAASMCVIGAVVGEWVGASSGLGYAMLMANGRAQTDVVFAALLLLAVMSVILRAIVDLLTRDLTPWAPETVR